MAEDDIRIDGDTMVMERVLDAPPETVWPT